MPPCSQPNLVVNLPNSHYMSSVKLFCSPETVTSVMWAHRSVLLLSSLSVLRDSNSTPQTLISVSQATVFPLTWGAQLTPWSHILSHRRHLTLLPRLVTQLKSILPRALYKSFTEKSSIKGANQTCCKRRRFFFFKRCWEQPERS